MNGETCSAFGVDIEAHIRGADIDCRVQPVIAALAKRAVHFRKNRRHAALRIAAIEKRNRIEHVAEIAEMREQINRPFG